jgi:hypothetical protein
MTALGRQLQARNHEIIFPYSSGAGGLPFISGLEKDYVSKDTREMSKIPGGTTLWNLVFGCCWLRRRRY